MGMTIADFCRQTPEEFEAVSEQWSTYNESLVRQSWERMRLATTIIVQPHIRKRMTPHDLLPFTWDNEEVHIDSREESETKFKELMATQAAKQFVENG